MKRLSFYLITASLTLVLGIAAASFRLPSRHRAAPIVPISKSNISRQLTSLNVAQQPLTFKGVRCPNKTCNFDTRVCYESSDGVLVVVVEETYNSPTEASEWLQLSLKNATNHAAEITERAPVLNARGQRVGERVVVQYASKLPESEGGASVEWTKGMKYDTVYSPSLYHAVEFEKAFLSGEVKLHSYFDFDLPPPNNY